MLIFSELYIILPLLLSFETDEEKAEYLNDLFKNTYIKDIIERNNLRGDVAIDTLIDVLALTLVS